MKRTPKRAGSSLRRRQAIAVAEQKGLPRATPQPEEPTLPVVGDDELETSNEAAAAPDEPEANDITGPDDALGLYLRQMGAIPLLNRQEELTLARELEM